MCAKSALLLSAWSPANSSMAASISVARLSKDLIRDEGLGFIDVSFLFVGSSLPYFELSGYPLVSLVSACQVLLLSEDSGF